MSIRTSGKNRAIMITTAVGMAGIAATVATTSVLWATTTYSTAGSAPTANSTPSAVVTTPARGDDGRMAVVAPAAAQPAPVAASTGTAPVAKSTGS